MAHQTTILPIAGGKGGIGKSLIAANLSIALAKAGHSTTVIDLDLGGSNLHTCLGLPNRFAGIGDYLRSGNLSFDQLEVETPWPNLKLIPGDGRTPFMANITYHQKIKILRYIKELDSRYVILDLGAGTSYNTLDFFRITPFGIVVTTPEKHSILNMLSFLKNVVYRGIDRAIIKRWDARDIFDKVCTNPITERQVSVREMTEKISRVDPEAAQAVQQLTQHFKPRFVFNNVNNPNELNSLFEAGKAMTGQLSLEADYFGSIFHDKKVRESFIKGTAFLQAYPDSPAAQNIQQLAKDVIKWWDKSLKNTDQWLMNQTKQIYANNS